MPTEILNNVLEFEVYFGKYIHGYALIDVISQNKLGELNQYIDILTNLFVFFGKIFLIFDIVKIVKA